MWFMSATNLNNRLLLVGKKVILSKPYLSLHAKSFWGEKKKVYVPSFKFC